MVNTFGTNIPSRSDIEIEGMTQSITTTTGTFDDRLTAIIHAAAASAVETLSRYFTIDEDKKKMLTLAFEVLFEIAFITCSIMVFI